MQDKKLEELVKEVNRLNTIFNESDEATIEIATHELKAAEERLVLYLKERKVG